MLMIHNILLGDLTETSRFTYIKLKWPNIEQKIWNVFYICLTEKYDLTTLGNL